MKQTRQLLLCLLSLILLLVGCSGGGNEDGETEAMTETEAVTEAPSLLPAVDYRYGGVFDDREIRVGFADGLLYVTAKEQGKVTNKTKEALGLTKDVQVEATYVAFGVYVAENGMTAVTFAEEYWVAYTYGGEGLADYRAALSGPCEGLSADKATLYRNRLAGVPETATLKPFDTMTFALNEADGTLTVEGYEGRSGLLLREYRDGYLATETVGKASGNRTVTAYFPDGSKKSEAHYRGETRQSETVYDEGGAIVTHYERQANGTAVETTYWSADRIKTTTTYDAEGRLTLSYAYDEKGQLVETRDGEGNVIENQYDEKGRYLVRKTTYPDGRVAMLEYRYDAMGHNIWIRSTYVDGSTMVSEREYNDKGLPVKDTYTRSDGTVRTAERIFDDMGRVIHLTDRGYDGTLTVTEYVIADNEWQNVIGKVTVTTPDGRKTVTAYDKSGNILSETRYDADGTEIFA